MQKLESIKQNRLISYAIIFVSYLIAIGIGIAVFAIFKYSAFLIRIWFANMVATIVIFVIGTIFQNASVYDPYWSIIPIAAVLLIPAYLGASGSGKTIVSLLVCLWGLQLTANWALSFQNLSKTDWRYLALQKENPRLWHAINLLGIHIMPTTVVYLCMLPVFLYFDVNAPFSGWTVVFAIIGFFAILVETFSNLQLFFFHRNPANQDKVFKHGLFAWIRHPNYLGEIVFWFSLYFIMLAGRPQTWFAIVGPIILVCLFRFISCPMMEKHLISHLPGYASYQQKTGMLLPKLKKFFSMKKFKQRRRNI